VHQFEITDGDELHKFEITPKAFANFSPAVGAQRQPWDRKQKNRPNPERVRPKRNPFRVKWLFDVLIPGFSLRSNRWAEISERLRRILKNFKLMQNS